MGRHSERPKISNDTIKPSYKYKLNKILAKIYQYIYSNGMKYNALNSEESLEEIIKSGKSFMRFGDGESKLMLGGDWPTQWHSQELSDGLWAIFEEYGHNSNYLIGVGNSHLTRSVNSLKKDNKHRTWRNSLFCMRRFLVKDLSLPFIEANMLRVGPVGLQRKQISKMWQDFSQVILVQNKIEYFDWFNKEYPNKESYFVKVPDKNAFEVMHKCLDEIMKLIEIHKLRKDKLVIMVAMGPSGKVMIHKLCKEGFCCYDMGNFFHMHLGDN